MIYPHSLKIIPAGLLCLSLGACMTAPPAGPSLMATPWVENLRLTPAPRPG